MSDTWIWYALFALGCYHGVNPGMGWLFAVALGLQDKSARSVFAALPPIAIGHVASVSLIVALAAVAQRELPANELRYGAAALLLGFGVYRLVRARHIRWVGMRVGFWGLTAWAFLMSTGHGAGLMLLPFLTGTAGRGMPAMRDGAMGAALGASGLAPSAWVLAVAVHTFGYVVAMTVVAWIVYVRVGVQLLRTAWFNFDLAWAVALIVSGLFVMLL